MLYLTPALEFQLGDIFRVHIPINTISDLSVLFQKFNRPENSELNISLVLPAPKIIPLTQTLIHHMCQTSLNKPLTENNSLQRENVQTF